MFPTIVRRSKALIFGSGLVLGSLAASTALAQSTTQPAPEVPPEAEDFILPDDDAVEPDDSAPISPEILAILEQMDEVIKALDSDATRTGNNWQFTLEQRIMIVVTDAKAARMRILTPIALIEDLPTEIMQRLMQANFDTALDARYAVAQELVWGAFLHPLDTLTVRDFASGILQTHSIGTTFGTTFSSGALSYGGGDSGAIFEEQLKALLEELEKRQST